MPQPYQSWEIVASFISPILQRLPFQSTENREIRNNGTTDTRPNAFDGTIADLRSPRLYCLAISYLLITSPDASCNLTPTSVCSKIPIVPVEPSLVFRRPQQRVCSSSSDLICCARKPSRRRLLVSAPGQVMAFKRIGRRPAFSNAGPRIF